jgi:hypothetical protein
MTTKQEGGLCGTQLDSQTWSGPYRSTSVRVSDCRGDNLKCYLRHRLNETKNKDLMVHGDISHDASTHLPEVTLSNSRNPVQTKSENSIFSPRNSGRGEISSKNGSLATDEAFVLNAEGLEDSFVEDPSTGKDERMGFFIANPQLFRLSPPPQSSTRVQEKF